MSIPSETPRLSSRLSSSADDLFEHDHGITPVSTPSDVVTDDSIPSEPPDGLGARLSSSEDDLFEHDHGITPGLADDLIEQSATSKSPDELSSRLLYLADDLFERDSEVKSIHCR